MVTLSAGGRGLTPELGLQEPEGPNLDPHQVPLVSPEWPRGPGGSSTQILRANRTINSEFNFTEISVATLEGAELQYT